MEETRRILPTKQSINLMGKITIDLGALMGAIQDAHSTVPQDNPDFANNVFFDSTTGQFRDASGNPINGSDVNYNQPYKDPGFWGNPTARRLAAQANFEYGNYPLMQNMQNSVAKNNTMKNIIAPVREYFPDTSDDELYAATGGRGFSNYNDIKSNVASQAGLRTGLVVPMAQTQMQQQNRALQFAGEQQPTIEATEASQNRLAQMNAEGAEKRGLLSNAVLDQQTLNQLLQVTQVDPKQIALDLENLKKQIGREPTINETLDLIAKQKLNEAKVGKATSDVDVNQIPLLQRTRELGNIGENLASQVPSGMQGYTALPSVVRVSQEGATKQTNPLYESPIEQAQAMMGGNNKPIATLANGSAVYPAPIISPEEYGKVPVSNGGRIQAVQTTPSEGNRQELTAPVIQPVRTGPLLNKAEFNKQWMALPRDQRDFAQDRLYQAIGQVMNVPREYIGSSVLKKSIASTVRNLMTNPDFIKKLDSLSPEQIDFIYRSALGQ